ncbi:MAG: anti-sigma factor [Actinomycetota bacterium]
MTDDNFQLATEDEAHIEAILRSMSEADLELDSPPASLWDDIDAAVRAEPTRQLQPPSGSTREPGTATVIDATNRFRRGTAFFAAAAAAVVVVIGAVVVAASGNDDVTEVVGEAQLVWDDGFVAEGTDVNIATSILDDGMGQSVRLEDGVLPTRADEDLELWLIGVDTAGELTIQTLGVIDDASGTYRVPEAFDADAFETVLVDISFEPRDGVATHSGASIVRGAIVDA